MKSYSTEEQIKMEAKRLGKTFSPLLFILMIASVIAYFANLLLFYNNEYNFFVFSIINMFTLYNIFTVMHDGVHGLLFPNNQKLNDAVSIFLGVINNFHFKSWKQIHILHHINANTKNDPEYLLTADRKKISILGTVFIYCASRITIVFPKSIQKWILNISTKRARIFLYLSKKNLPQSRFYSTTLYITLLSVIFFGFDSIIFLWYVSTFLSLIVILPLLLSIPHAGNFDKKDIKENPFMVAQNYFIPSIIVRLFPSISLGSYHLTHHIYPTVQVTRLAKFTKSINWLIEEKSKK